MKILVAIMTYNRGNYLLNCLRSIRENFDFEYTLHIYDDNSNDKETVNILKYLENDFFVSYPQQENSKSNTKVKGLYNNMNSALNFAYSNLYDLLIIIQDDMQVIRRVGNELIIQCSKIVKHENVAAVGYLFRKKNHLKSYEDLLVYDNDNQCYKPKKDTKSQKYMTGIADTGIFSIKNLKKFSWQFGNDEGLNMEKGRDLGLVRNMLKDPIAAYLPWPYTFRSSYPLFKRILLNVLNKYYKTGFHPYKYLTSNSLEKFLHRPVFDMGFAEDHLELIFPIELEKPYNFYDPIFALKNKIYSLFRLK